MLSQSRSLEFLIVQNISYSKLYSTFWAWLDERYVAKQTVYLESPDHVLANDI